jgi:hypothetical protein
MAIDVIETPPPVQDPDVSLSPFSARTLLRAMQCAGVITQEQEDAVCAQLSYWWNL